MPCLSGRSRKSTYLRAYTNPPESATFTSSARLGGIPRRASRIRNGNASTTENGGTCDAASCTHAIARTASAPMTE
ncbi:unnamed protein product, partial [Ixodes pacificus]